MSLLSGWAAVWEAAGPLAAHQSHQARIADLAIARALGERHGLCRTVATPAAASPEAIRTSLEELALAGNVSLKEGLNARGPWRTLMVEAGLAAEMLDRDNSFDDWSRATLAADARRKPRGAYGTPAPLAQEFVPATIRPIGSTDRVAICDPAAGHGALLIQALRYLTEGAPNDGAVQRRALGSLHGVELDPFARELCCLMLWLSAPLANASLREVARQIVRGNALIGLWQGHADGGARAPGGVHWAKQFPQIFERGGFDVILANPPWDSLRHRVDESDPAAADRALTRSWLSVVKTPGRHDLPPLYTHQGTGDNNVYKGFVELFPHLLRPGGRLGALLPGAFASDLGMREARRLYMQSMRIESWTGYENLERYFPIDSRYKFGVLLATRDPRGTKSTKVRFFARRAEEISTAGHLSLTRSQVRALGGPAEMIVELRDAVERDILLTANRGGRAFFDERGPFGKITYRREVDLTLDRAEFIHISELPPRSKRLGDGTYSLGSSRFVPLLEGRMIGQYDFFQKSWVSGFGRTASWVLNGGRPSRCFQPQYVIENPNRSMAGMRIAFCDVTAATNTRTMLASWVPNWPCGNTAPVLYIADLRRGLGLLAVLNSMVFDWIVRRYLGGLHINRFYLEAMPLPSVSERDLDFLARYAARRVWAHQLVQALPRNEVRGLAEMAAGGHPTIEEGGRVERIVGSGYGLTGSYLASVFSSDKRDRRGLWRYYSAVPGSRDVAEAVLRASGPTDRRSAQRTFLDAALDALRANKRPMSTAELAREVLAAGMVKSHGKTPEATLRRELYAEVRKGPTSRLAKRAAPGQTRARRGSVRWELRQA